MNNYLRDKLIQKLESMPDDKGYAVLDYVEFLESKYAERPTSAAGANPLSRFADAVEEKLRQGKVSATTIAETMGFMNKAVNALSGAAAAGKSVASDLMSATNRVVDAAADVVVPRSAGAPSAPGGTTGASSEAPARGGAGAPATPDGSAGAVNPS